MPILVVGSLLQVVRTKEIPISCAIHFTCQYGRMNLYSKDIKYLT
jgi:hypothetical protein